MRREITIADLKELYAIELACYPFPWSQKNFTHTLMQSEPQYGIVIAGHLAGYTLIQRIFPEAELLNIAVHPHYQKQGWGEALLTSLLEELTRENYERLFLEVRVSNKTAMRLYERLGFNQIGERIGYYPTKRGREDALIYAIELTI